MSNKKTIVVFGATGHQGHGLINALIGKEEYAIRAITRNIHSDKAMALAAKGIEVTYADLNKPETLEPALKHAYGVFLVTNFWDEDIHIPEYELVNHVIAAAKSNQVSHFIWSTLPNVHDISAGKYEVVHFTNKARANTLVSQAGFKYHSFIEAPSYFQNLAGGMGPQPTGNGDQKAWVLPIDPTKKCLHAGDINDLGKLALQVFQHPEQTGQGQTFSLAANLFSWQDLANTLNDQGHNVIVEQVAAEHYENFFAGAREVREMMSYFEEYTYFGPDAEKHIAAANALLGDQITSFEDWAKINMPA